MDHRINLSQISRIPKLDVNAGIQSIEKRFRPSRDQRCDTSRKWWLALRRKRRMAGRGKHTVHSFSIHSTARTLSARSENKPAVVSPIFRAPSFRFSPKCSLLPANTPSTKLRLPIATPSLKYRTRHLNSSAKPSFPPFSKTFIASSFDIPFRPEDIAEASTSTPSPNNQQRYHSAAVRSDGPAFSFHESSGESTTRHSPRRARFEPATASA